MAKLVATVTDAVDAMLRRLGGQRLCDYCNQWAKKPHQSGSFYFCDSIHASIFFKKQQDLMKQALEKKRALEKERSAEREMNPEKEKKAEKDPRKEP